MIANEVLKKLSVDIGERPVGTSANQAATDYLSELAAGFGFEVSQLPIKCLLWQTGSSHLRSENRDITSQHSGGSSLTASDGTVVPVFPGPFSRSLRGSFETVVVETLQQLKQADAEGKLVIIHGAPAEEPIMPRDFPFYYPDEHRAINDAIEAAKPIGVVAITGRHPMCGLNPFPLFEDGTLSVPTAYSADRRILDWGQVRVDLVSESRPGTAFQPVFRRPGLSSRRVVLCAHMDTKYGTPGALDNAAGVATLCAAMERLENKTLPFDLEVVPFNGEDYYSVPGQLAYLDARTPVKETISLVINIDANGHRGSANAFSGYNLGEAQTRTLNNIVTESAQATIGEQWIAGDHGMFVFQEIPCVAVTSSDLEEAVLALTHTSADVAEEVDPALLEAAADAITQIVVKAERIMAG